jgi:hypothetical protein
MKKLYTFAVLVELVGISISSIGVGLLISGDSNPANYLIAGGSVIIAIGSLLFAKVAPWLRGETK